MEKIAIDLLWLRPGKVGGTESYIRNLLDGMMKLDEEFRFVLLVSRDNRETFSEYEQDARYQLLTAGTESANIGKRIIWQNLYQNKFLRKHGIRKCFEPVYCKPWLNGGVEYICVIHDIQAYHYPRYHPFHEVAYSRLCWRMDVWNAAGILTISNWVKEDFEQKYHRRDLRVIYNPISVRQEQTEDFEKLQNRYQIEKGQFFYTVSQMIPHKNLRTLISVMEKLAGRGGSLPRKLLISGVNGSAAKQLQTLIAEKQLEESVLLTGFVRNEERNTLYKYCHTFLFPSVFEGFGMPPIEAMLFGARVVTTRCASIPEVTQEKAVYVQDPYSVEEWVLQIEQGGNRSSEMDFGRYAPETISRQYLQVLKEPVWKKK